MAGTPVGTLWTAGGEGDPGREADDVAKLMSATLVTGFERTSWQDVSFGLRQLTDVAVKALSPGINDPTTAVHALAHSSALLCQFARHDLGPRVRVDEQGRTRVVLARPDLAAMLRLAMDQPRRYGAGDPAVLARLFMLLQELAWVCAPRDHPTVAEEASRLRRLVARQDFDEEDVAALQASGRAVDAALEGHWTAHG